MEIQNKTVLVLGAAGVTGQGVCRAVIRPKPKMLVFSPFY